MSALHKNKNISSKVLYLPTYLLKSSFTTLESTVICGFIYFSIIMVAKVYIRPLKKNSRFIIKIFSNFSEGGRFFFIF